MKPRWAEITALFGGTFDPPHLGHRAAVAGLFAHPGVARVIVLPSGTPAQKAGLNPMMTPAEHRLAMARLTFAPGSDLPGEVLVDDRELKREGPSFTFDTLREMRSEHPQLAFVIGTDQLKNFPTWKRFPEVLTLCHWIVLERKPRGANEAREGLEPLVASGILKPEGPTTWSIARSDRSLSVIPTEAPELSSTHLRQKLETSGQVPENTLVQSIEAYLKTHRLYGTQ